MIANRFPADPGHMLHSLKIVFLLLVAFLPPAATLCPLLGGLAVASLSPQGVTGGDASCQAQAEPEQSCQAALHCQEGLRMIRDDKGSQLL